MSQQQKYWLLKSEPDTFSIDDLAKRSKQTEPWTGVRNYQARNMLKHEMQKGDLAFFYHSSCEVPGIVGIVEIVSEGYPDKTAFDSKSEYFDPKSRKENPTWYCVDVKLVKKFPRVISLAELRTIPALKNMILLRKGNRLSVIPVSAEEWKVLLAMQLR